MATIDVVAAAIVRDGAVLAARRNYPPGEAGRWEFPGGKVAVGESHDAALIREIGEELGVEITIAGWLPVPEEQAAFVDVGSGATVRLHVARCRLIDPQARLASPDHDLLRWLSVDDLAAVDWLDPDRPFVAHLRSELA